MSISDESEIRVYIHKIAATDLRNVKNRAGDKNNVYIKLEFGDLWHTETNVQKAAGSEATWHFGEGQAQTDMLFNTSGKDIKILPLHVTAMDANTYTPHKLIGSGQIVLPTISEFGKLSTSAHGAMSNTEVHVNIPLDDGNGENAGSIDIGLQLNVKMGMNAVADDDTFPVPSDTLPQRLSMEKSQSFSQGQAAEHSNIYPSSMTKAHSFSYAELQASRASTPSLISSTINMPTTRVAAEAKNSYRQPTKTLPSITESLFQATVEVSIGGSSIVSLLSTLQAQIDELKNRPNFEPTPAASSSTDGISIEVMEAFERRMENMLNRSQAENMAAMERRLQELLKERDDQSLEIKLRQLTKRVQDLEDANGEGVLIAIQSKFGGRIESLEQRMSKLEKTVAENLITDNNSNEEDAQMGSKIREQLDRLKAVEVKVEAIQEALPAIESKVIAVEEVVETDHQEVAELAKRVSRLGDSYSVCDARIAELYQLLSRQMEDLGKLQALIETLPDECLDKVRSELELFDSTKANRSELSNKADLSLLLSKADQSDISRLNDLSSDLGGRISVNKQEVKENLESLARNIDKKLEAMGSWILKLLRRVPDDSQAGGTDIGKVRCLVCDSTSKQQRETDIVHGGPALNPHGKTLRKFPATSSAPIIGFGATVSPGPGTGGANETNRDTSPSRMSSPVTMRRPMPQEPGSTLAQGRPRSANATLRSSAGSPKRTTIHRSSLEIPAEVAARITNPDTAAKLHARIDARINGPTDTAGDHSPPPKGEMSPTSRLVATGQPLLDLDDSAVMMEREYITPQTNGRASVFELAAQNTQKQREMSETYFKDLDS